MVYLAKGCAARLLESLCAYAFPVLGCKDAGLGESALQTTGYSTELDMVMLVCSFVASLHRCLKSSGDAARESVAAEHCLAYVDDVRSFGGDLGVILGEY
jgi:hypothetical protein